jgi:phosphoglycerate dehydrogenase-like enzyme
VSVHVPLLPETRGLFNPKTFAQMKPTSFLINTSRGPVVDEAALVQALENKKIAGAALDVYEKEPLIQPGLKRPNVVLAPHIASASLETRTKMACMAAQNVVALFKSQRPPNILNPEVLKAN